VHPALALHPLVVRPTLSVAPSVNTSVHNGVNTSVDNGFSRSTGDAVGAPRGAHPRYADEGSQGRRLRQGSSSFKSILHQYLSSDDEGSGSATVTRTSKSAAAGNGSSTVSGSSAGRRASRDGRAAYQSFPALTAAQHEAMQRGLAAGRTRKTVLYKTVLYPGLGRGGPDEGLRGGDGWKMRAVQEGAGATCSSSPSDLAAMPSPRRAGPTTLLRTRTIIQTLLSRWLIIHRTVLFLTLGKGPTAGPRSQAKKAFGEGHTGTTETEAETEAVRDTQTEAGKGTGTGTETGHCGRG